MKINIYYGGRGILGDPSLYAVKKMMQVFEELNVKTQRYDLFDQKNTITTLPQTLKDVDGVILATTVEWHGIGGFMTSFLDACWLYGDKEKIARIYMAPVVMSTTYGEKEAEADLIKAWETLGGLTCPGISGYLPELGELESSESYLKIIEKSAENIYRAINQRQQYLPVSNKAVCSTVNRTRKSFLTAKETEQLSEYIADETYVSKQKKDIMDLASQFKDRLNVQNKEDLSIFLKSFKAVFHPLPEAKLHCKINFRGKDKTLALRIERGHLEAEVADLAYPDLELTLEYDMLLQIIEGKNNFYRSFMEGSIVSKGDFRYLRQLDELFPFTPNN